MYYYINLRITHELLLVKAAENEIEPDIGEFTCQLLRQVQVLR